MLNKGRYNNLASKRVRVPDACRRKTAKEDGMMKKIHFKQKRHFVTAVCLLVGMMVLTTSVYANYDNANGYSNYKSALKNLMLQTNNVTADGKVEFYVDGNRISGVEAGVKFGKKAKSSYERTLRADGSILSEYWTYENGKEYVSYNAETNSYWKHQAYYDGQQNLFGINPEDETNQKLIRFMELGADLVVGDLKNNVVLVGQKDGIKEYQIEVSRNQMPEIINAGLSLLFTSVNEYSGGGGIYYEDWDEAYRSFCEAEYGEVLPEDPYDENGDFDTSATKYRTEDAYWEVYDKYQSEFYEYVDGLYENCDDQECLYIRADGSYRYYDDYEAYWEDTAGEQALLDEDNLYLLLGSEPYIESAKMTVKINDKGELLGNSLEVTLAGRSSSGEKHTATFKGEATLRDYGTTTADVFDPTGKELRN